MDNVELGQVCLQLPVIVEVKTEPSHEEYEFHDEDFTEIMPELVLVKSEDSHRIGIKTETKDSLLEVGSSNDLRIEPKLDGENHSVNFTEVIDINVKTEENYEDNLEEFDTADIINITTELKPRERCDICQEDLNSGPALISHRYTHTEETRFTCLICYKTFQSRYNLYIHIVSQYAATTCLKLRVKERPFKCEQCPREYSTSRLLTAHKRSHTGDGMHECHICHRQFVYKCILNQHNLRVHLHHKPYQCTVCHKAYGSKKSMHTHVQLAHSKEKPYQCEFCGAEFRKIRQFNKHKLVHDINECNICHKKFKSRYSLGKHICKQANWPVNKHEFSCEVCGRLYCYKGDLLKHRRCHEDVGNGTCEDSFCNPLLLL